MVVSAERRTGEVGPPAPTRRRVVARRVSAVGSDLAVEVAVLATVVAVGLGIATRPDVIPISLLFPVLVGAGLLLPPRRLLVVILAAAVTTGVWAPKAGLGFTRTAGVVVSLALVTGIVLVASRSRSELGTRGFGGDRMFVELRDRISQVGQVPRLPEGWSVTTCVLSAHGDQFSGDFVVAHLDPDDDHLELALVDVSGKGTGAGTRSLLLSGALGGLLGAVHPSSFLRAANEYLVRQGWDEGFATAVHLELDLRTGAYSVANAGHPPPARYTSVRGRWTLLESHRGPLLGVLPSAYFPRMHGVLDPGDALLVYSDGVVETRGRDLRDGTDRMLGIAEQAVLAGADVAREVCERARSGEDDDRAALAVRRR